MGAHFEEPEGGWRFRRVRTGKFNASYWVLDDTMSAVDHPLCLLRIAPPDETGQLFYERHMMRQEPELHRLIHTRAANLPVAEILAADFSHQLIDRDYLIMSVLPGEPLSEVPDLSANMLERALGQVGTLLAELHAVTAESVFGANQFGYLGPHRPLPAFGDWASAFRSMWRRLVSDVVASGAYNTAQGEFMEALLDLHLKHFDRPVQSRLLHMDVWSQNILVDREGNVTGLVDFDRALWGDVEMEYAVLEYCSISTPAFWEGYGQPAPDGLPAAIRRQFYLLYEIQKYMPIRIWRDGDAAAARRYRDQSLMLAGQLIPQRRSAT
jgi:fructosamine-3-kinase